MSSDIKKIQRKKRAVRSITLTTEERHVVLSGAIAYMQPGQDPSKHRADIKSVRKHALLQDLLEAEQVEYDMQASHDDHAVALGQYREHLALWADEPPEERGRRPRPPKRVKVDGDARAFKFPASLAKWVQGIIETVRTWSGDVHLIVEVAEKFGVEFPEEDELPGDAELEDVEDDAEEVTEADVGPEEVPTDGHAS